MELQIMMKTELATKRNDMQNMRSSLLPQMNNQL